MFPSYNDFNDYGIMASVSFKDHPVAAAAFSRVTLDAGTKTTMNVKIEEVVVPADKIEWGTPARETMAIWKLRVGKTMTGQVLRSHASFNFFNFFSSFCLTCIVSLSLVLSCPTLLYTLGYEYFCKVRKQISALKL